MNQEDDCNIEPVDLLGSKEQPALKSTLVNLQRNTTGFKLTPELALLGICSRLQIEILASIEDDIPDSHQWPLWFFSDAISAWNAEFPASCAVKVIIEQDALLRSFSAYIATYGYPRIAADILIGWNDFLKTQPAFYEAVFSKNIEHEE